MDLDLDRLVEEKRAGLPANAEGAQVLRLPEDWELAHTTGMNVLFIGPGELTHPLLDALESDFRKPVVTVVLGELWSLPLDQGGTVILHNVPDLGLADQHRLFDWMERSGRHTRVISTTTKPLQSLIAAGAFIEALYYRLNGICIDSADGLGYPTVQL